MHGKEVPGGAAPHRVAVLAHDHFGPFTSKTVMAVIRYGPDRVVAVIDRSKRQGDASEHIGPAGEGIDRRSVVGRTVVRPSVLSSPGRAATPQPW